MKKQFPIFRTVTVGQFGTCEVMMESLARVEIVKQTIKNSNHAERSLNRFLRVIPLEERKIELDIVVATGKDMGFPIDFWFGKSVSVREIYDRIRNLGYELCPPEVRPVLASNLQYGTCSINELLIAMDPIWINTFGESDPRADPSYPRVFEINCKIPGQYARGVSKLKIAQLGLNYDITKSYGPVSGGKWAFVKPRKKSE